MSGASTQYIFSGHETFSFRYPWLKKGFDAVCEDGGVFLRDDAITTLGVGKNMVRAIRHWCLTAGILEPVGNALRGVPDAGNSGFSPSPRYPGAPGRVGVRGLASDAAMAGDPAHLRPTPLGRLLLSDDGLDPYLEDPATLWLLHWQIAANRQRAATWFYAFSHFNEPEFSRDLLTAALVKWTDTLGGKKVAPSSLRRDVEVFLRTYVPSRQSKGGLVEDSLDCPLVELGLISSFDGSQSFEFRRGPQENLPDGILLYATLAYWDANSPTAQTLSLADLSRRPGSPGRLFKIDEGSLARRYEGIENWTNGAISYRETAGLAQLYRHQLLAPLDALQEAYATEAV